MGVERGGRMMLIWMLFGCATKAPTLTVLAASSLTEVMADGATHRMVCLRNPWGNEHEWNGPFSDAWEGWSRHRELLRTLDVRRNEADGKCPRRLTA